MKERPIILTAWEVRAILAGTKTRITRPLRHQPPADHRFPQGSDDEYWWNEKPGDDDMMSWWPSYDKGLRSPFGAPGDLLWGREAWWQGDMYHPDEIKYDADLWSMENGYPHRAYPSGESKYWNKRSAIYMPRWAARIILRVETESVGRVQDISDDEAEAEGFIYTDSGCFDEPTPVERFVVAWDARYAKRGLGFDTNPWAFSATFPRVADAATGADGRE